MNLLDNFNQSQKKKNYPKLQPGQTVRVHQKVKEGGKERIQVFEGLVIAQKGGKGATASFTVRRTAGGFGVERTFPLHSPNIKKVEVVRKGKARRAKLYYLRERVGKRARLSAASGDQEEQVFEEPSEKTEAKETKEQKQPVPEAKEGETKEKAEEKTEPQKQKEEKSQEKAQQKPTEEKKESSSNKTEAEKSENKPVPDQSQENKEENKKE